MTYRFDIVPTDGGVKIPLLEETNTPYQWFFEDKESAISYLDEWRSRIIIYLDRFETDSEDEDSVYTFEFEEIKDEIAQCKICKRPIDLKEFAETNFEYYDTCCRDISLGLRTDSMCDIYLNRVYSQRDGVVPEGDSLTEGLPRFYLCTEKCYNTFQETLQNRLRDVLTEILN